MPKKLPGDHYTPPPHDAGPGYGSHGQSEDVGRKEKHFTPTPKPHPVGPGFGDPDEHFADAVEVSGKRMGMALTPVRESSLYNMPDTLVYTAGVKNDATLTALADDQLQFLLESIGQENVGAVLGADAITDPVVRENLIAAVNYTRNISYGSVPWTPGGSLGNTYTDEDLIEMASTGADLSTLSPVDKARLGGLAGALVENLLELPNPGFTAEALDRAQYIAQTGDISVAVSPQQVQLFQKVKDAYGRLGGVRQTAETPELAQIGIEQVSQRGGHTIVFNEEWAKAHPDEAFAVKLMAEASWPEVNFEFGRQGGIPGWILGKFGTVVDYASAPFGAGLEQINEYGEHFSVDDKTRAKALAYADRLEKAMADGTIPEDKLDDAVRVMAQARDIATDDTGWQEYKQQIFRNTNPRAVGMGFADSYMRAADYQPGDPGYNLLYGTVALAANIIFDPTTYVTAGLAAFRHARLAPEFRTAAKATHDVEALAQAYRLEDETLTAAQALSRAQDTVRLETRAAQVANTAPEISRSFLRNGFYRMLSSTPDRILEGVGYAGRHYKKVADVLWPMREAMGKDDFATMLATYFQDARGLGGDTSVAKFLASAESKADLEWSLLATQAGSGAELPNLARMDSELAHLTEQIADMAPGVEREAAIAREAWLKSALNGRDWVRPMRQAFSSKQLKQLARRAKSLQRADQDLLHSAMTSLEQLPRETMESPAALKEWIKLHPEVESGSRSLMQKWRDWWKPTGFGETLVFPGTSPDAKALRHMGIGTEDIARRLRAANPDLSVAAARTAAKKMAQESPILADSAEDSLEYLVATARNLGLREERIQQIIKPWVAGELGTPAKNYHFIRDAWESMILESPRLRPSDKVDLSRMWNSLASERSPSYIEITGADGIIRHEPTWFDDVVDEVTGNVDMGPTPAYEADQFQTFRLPTPEAMHQYLSHVQRTMNDWRKTGGAMKLAVAYPHLILTQGFQAFTNLWKTGVLATRVAALPTRILSEEMLRMGALDYASLVWHPMDWFQSTGLGVRWFKNTDEALMGGSPTMALGAAVNDAMTNPNMRLLRQGRRDVTYITTNPEEKAAFFRSYSDRVGRVYASPYARIAAAHLDDNERALNAIKGSSRWDSFKTVVEKDTKHTYAEAVERLNTSTRQYIGTGENAPLVEVALRRGSVTVDGEQLRVGTVEFSDWLRRSYEEGKWVPGTRKVALSSGDYLPTMRFGQAIGETGHWLRDKWFNVIYSSPDIAAARSPLWRQMAAREFRNLVRHGYNPETARELARAYAARGTADLLFSIGAKTPGEYFLRNLMPFFPAYRELANTWLIRVPMRLGSGTWALGALTLARRADVYLKFFQNAGFLKKDANGEWVVPLPMFKPIMRAVLGEDVNWTPTASAGSFAGVLPIPVDFYQKDEEGNPLPLNERVRSILPSLGGTSAAVLGALNKASGGALDDVEKWTTLYGADSSLGPIAVDRFFEAWGITPFWMSAAAGDMHEALRTSAVQDGMRLAWDTHQPKNWEQFDKDGDGYLSPDEAKTYAKENPEEIRAWVEQGEKYATNLYLLKGMASMLLPFSVSVSNEEKDLTTSMWNIVNSMPEDGSAASVWVNSFKQDYPNLEPYLTRKTEDLRPGITKPVESISQFYKFVQSGEIKFPDPYDWGAFVVGMHEYGLYQSRVDAIYEQAGEDAGAWMTNFDAKNQITTLRQNWQHYLDLSHTYDETQQSKSFEEMFNRYQSLKAKHEGEEPDISLEQQRLLEFDGIMREYALKLAPGEPSTDNFFKLRDEAYSALGDPTTPLGKGVAWAFDAIFNPYYEKQNQLYNELDTLNEAEEGPVRQAIRHLSERYDKKWKNPDHPEWGVFPSPEKYYFSKLNEVQQDRKRAEWANLPAEWLTSFQRKQVGYSIPDNKQDAASKLADFIEKQEAEIDHFVDKENTTRNRSDVVKMIAQNKADAAKYAEELGLSKYWKEMNQPDYKRISMALGLDKNPIWKKVEGFADRLISAWTAADVSLAGTTQEAKMVQAWMADEVRILRRQPTKGFPSSQTVISEFDDIMMSLQYALSDSDSPLGPDELVAKLFFDVYDTGNSFWLSKGRDIAARRVNKELSGGK